MNKCAIIGFGRWGKKLIEEFNRYSEIIYAVNNGNKEDINWLRKNFPKILHTTDLEKVIKRDDIDFIIIATPIKTHYRIAKLCLENNKNIFLEKPPCLHFKEGLTLLRIAKQKKQLIFVDNTYSFDPAFKNLSSKIKNRVPQKTKFTWLKFGSFDSDILWNLAYHDIFLSIELFGVPISTQLKISFPNKVQIELFYNKQLVLIEIDRNYKKTSKKTMLLNFKQANYLLQKSALYKIQQRSKKLIFKSKDSAINIACSEFIKNQNQTKKNYEQFKKSLEVVKIIENLKSTLHTT